MLNYNFDLDEIIYMQNEELYGNITYNTIISNTIKANNIYMEILNDMIKHLTNDTELGKKKF